MHQSSPSTPHLKTNEHCRYLTVLRTFLQMAAIVDDDEIIVEILPTIRTYRSGRVERLQPTDFIPASLDLLTAVLSKDVPINPSTALSARLYLPTPYVDRIPVFVFFHGGGFCIGSAFSSIYHSFLNSLVSMAQVIAISVDYRLAPEHPLPAAYDDCWEAIQWISSNGSCGGSGETEPWLTEAGDLGKIFVAGDSTGANIAHNIAVRLGHNKLVIEGLVLMHPYFWGKERIGSERKEMEGTMLKGKDADALWPFVCPATSGLDDPRVNPTEESLAALGCRRVHVSVAGRDLLRERGRLYFEKLEQSGWEGEAEFWEGEGEDHVFFLLNPRGEKAVEFMKGLVNFLNKN